MRSHVLVGRVLAIVVATAFIGSCNQDTPSAPEDGSRLGAKVAGKEIPWKEAYEATGGIVGTCDGGVLVSLEGGGHATHIGRYTISNSHCLDLATGVFTNGEFTKVAANGDRLFGTYSGTSTPLPSGDPCIARFHLEADLEFTGGTGRFASATGETELSGTQATNVCQPELGFPTEVTAEIVGTISSVGSALGH